MTGERTADIRPVIDTALVRRLVHTQFPQWAGLPLKLLDRAGSDHVIHRLGEELSVRLPRHPGAMGQARKEAAWLPRLAPHLPLAVPVPMAVGEPDFGYPWPWAVSRWLDGEVATVEGLAESADALGVDDATWTRGRGWAVATGLNAYTAYAADHPRVAAQTSRQITEALIG
ncbi:phosphotransferase [Streptomyces sp. NPDC102437]|uniref:phosphotransferase n=1 Tax=Streptomyces sp. NPDC102437 TaxID=3366175 RepID=UPI003830DC17